MSRRIEQSAAATAEHREAGAPGPDGCPSPADRSRLEEMFRAYHQQVWRMLRRRGLPPDVAGDVAQQTFVVALERLADIRRESERAFLMSTALRIAQATGRRQRPIELAEEAVPGEDRSTLDLLDMVLSHVDQSLIDVFVLFELEGFSSPEIARLLDIPVGTVASRLRRAREQFRAVARRVELTLQREGRDRRADTGGGGRGEGT